MIVYHGSPHYDQITFVTQRAIDRLLIFDSSVEV